MIWDIAAWATVLSGAAVVVSCAIVSLTWALWKVLDLFGALRRMWAWYASYRYFGPAPGPEPPVPASTDAEEDA